MKFVAHNISKASLVLGLFAILSLSLLGCKVVDRLSPNTMVKTYQPAEGSKNFEIEFYEVKFRIRARQIGNKVGVDNYLINLELTSQDKVELEEVGRTVPSVRLKELTISLPGDENVIVVGSDKIENPPDGSPPQIFRDRLLYNFNARDVFIPGEPEEIIVTAEFEYSTPSEGPDVRAENVKAELSFSKKMKWFKY